MRETQTASAPRSSNRYLTFVLDGGVYAVEILAVREIIAMHAITPLPRLPDFVRGVINLRGRIIPVIDLRLRMELHAAEETRANCIVVFDIELSDGQKANIGCVVDSVREVADIKEKDLQEPPASSQGGLPEAIRALALQDEGRSIVTILDITMLLRGVVDVAGLDHLISQPEAGAQAV